jgi:hypothetical protein
VHRHVRDIRGGNPLQGLGSICLLFLYTSRHRSSILCPRLCPYPSARLFVVASHVVG